MNSTFVVLSRAVSIIGGVLLSASVALAQTPSVGPNVNMITGTSWPAGDPMLNKQNEGAAIVTSAHPLHLLAAGNDYRLVNPAVPLPNSGGGDAWIMIYKSVDGGATWRASVLAGCPLPINDCGDTTNPIKALNLDFAADPTWSAGPYNTAFLTFIAANRNSNANGVTAVQRFFDRNNNNSVNCAGNTVFPGTNVPCVDDPYQADAVNIIDSGTPGQGKDKSWNKADIPGRWFNTGTCDIPGYGIGLPAFNVYISLSNFTGQADSNAHPQILIARSTDCGKTFGKPVKVSNSIQTNQGSYLTIDQQTGTVYVFWRVKADVSAGQPDAIYMNKSSNGGSTWDNQPTLVTNIIPFDQGGSGFTFRTLTFPAATVSVDSTSTPAKSRVHVVWANRSSPLDSTGKCAPVAPATNCDARIKMLTAPIVDANGNLGAWVLSDVDKWAASRLNGTLQDGFTVANPDARGHQFMPAVNFAGGKLAVIWYDQRLDHTRGYLSCPTTNEYGIGACTEARVAVGNLAKGTPGARARVFTEFLSDAPTLVSVGGTVKISLDPEAGLVRRHTVDVFGAMATPADKPLFASTRISQYPFGSRSVPVPAGQLKPSRVAVQQLQNPPDLPVAADGKIAFIGDYLDIAAQTILPTPPVAPATTSYKFNCGTDAPGCAVGDRKSVFHPVWTDNRDVIRPYNGSWANHTPITVFNATSTGVVANTLSCKPGQDGSRNSNLYTAFFVDSFAALVKANTKRLDPNTLRGFVVGVQNLSAVPHTYTFKILPGSAVATFDRSNTATNSINAVVPARSSSWRTVWAKSSTANASIAVTISDEGGNLSNLVLNPDPTLASADLATVDLTNADLANVDLTNVDLTNVDLTNADLTNVAMGAVDLTNVDLTNVDLTNADLTNRVLTNAALTNVDLTNVDLTNVDLTNADLTNVDLTNADLTNVDLTNADLTNVDLTNADLANVDLTNADLTNADLTNSAPADATFTVQSSGTTDTTTDVKTLLRDQQIPTGYKMHLVLRKVMLVPGSVSRCLIGINQQSAQVASVPTPSVTNTNDSTLGQFYPQSDATIAPRLPLSAGEKGQLTLRIVKKTNCTFSGETKTCDAGDPKGDLAKAFGQSGEKFVDIAGAGKTTSIPLIIRTLLLPSVIFQKITTLPVSAFSGDSVNTINWSLFGATLSNPPPSWVTLGSTTGTTVSLVINKPPALGTFPITLKVTQGVQSDTQLLQLVVTKNNP